MSEPAGSSTAAEAAVSATAVVRRSDEVARGIRVIALDVQGSAPVPVPGQFYQVDCGGGREHLLPRPIGAFDARGSDGGLALAFMVEAVGWGTERLCSLGAGDEIRVLGPLGRGFSIPGSVDTLLVSGGVGLAPLHFLAMSMDRMGLGYTMLAGVSSRDKCPSMLAALNGDVTIVSDDGSVGDSGLVCDKVGARLELGAFSMVYTCGPEAMMSVVAREAEARDVPCEVSLDARMACGIGACRGCVKAGAEGKNLCVCTDGPVFDSRAVDWSAK